MKSKTQILDEHFCFQLDVAVHCYGNLLFDRLFFSLFVYTNHDDYHIVLRQHHYAVSVTRTQPMCNDNEMECH